jgi:hypothetical protein
MFQYRPFLEITEAQQQRVLALDFMRLITCCIGSKPVSKTASQNVPLSTGNRRQNAEVVCLLEERNSFSLFYLTIDHFMAQYFCQPL